MHKAAARRALTLAVSLAASLSFPGTPLYADPLEFDIPAGPATRSVTRFAQQAGIPVLFPYELLQGQRTRTLKGRLETAAGLEKLLQGTGVVAVRNADGQFSLQPAARGPRPRDTTEVARDSPSLPMDILLEEVAVTGTRIEREGMNLPIPVAVISKPELDAMGPSMLADALVQLPYFLNSDTPQSQSFGSSGAAGASYLNLRGIGSNRTLVLLDGRRITPSTRNGTVDIAQLPRSLLRRVEVVTGGASASYGSDAVTGVVNLIIDPEFDGLKLYAQGGHTTHGDFDNHELSATWGGEISERTSLLVAAEYSRAQGIRGYRHRDWFTSESAIENTAPGGPTEVFARDVHATGYTYGGLITAGPLAGTQFLPGGATAAFLPGRLAGSLTQSGGSGVDPAADLVWLLPDQARANGFLRLENRPTARTTIFLQSLFARSASHFGKDPASLWGPWEATIFADNAFLPESIRAGMARAGIESFKMGRVSNGDLGDPRTDHIDMLASLTAGLKRDGERWQLDAFVQAGQNRSVIDYQDVLRLDRIYRALDSVIDPATGRIVCRSTLSNSGDGCVPLNLFGEGSPSQAARHYVTEGHSSQVQAIRELVAEASLQGRLFDLPAGPARAALGTSWRRESMATRAPRYPDTLTGKIVEPAAALGYRGLPASYSGNANIFERTVEVAVAGNYDVGELFGELVLPLLRDQPGAGLVELTTSLREAAYSGSGSIPAWKAGLDWQVSSTLRLRATRSRDIRAGSLAERFDFSTSGVTIVDRGLATPRSYAVIGVRTGNPNVDPEKSDTTTFGIVLKPPSVEGLSLSADYYDIRILDAIANPGVQGVINRCASGDEGSCSLVERNAVTGLIARVRNPVFNIAEARTRGVDVEMGWRRPIALFGNAESIAFRAFVNRTLESSSTNSAGNPVDRVGQTGLVGGAPRWQANLSLAYRRDAWQVTLQERLVSSGSYNATNGPGSIDDNHVRGMDYTTLRTSWETSRWPGLTISATVNNLFDRNPPRAGDWGFLGSIPTNESLFDVLGRRFVVGIQYRR